MKSSVVFVLIDGDKVLQEFRLNPNKAFYNEWIFPGGFTEGNERPVDAMLREAREELDVDVLDWRALDQFEDNNVMIYPFLVTKWIGNVPDKSLDTGNPLGWHYIHNTILSKVPSVRYIGSMVKHEIQH